MAVHELYPDLYQITMPTPFAVGDVHAFYADIPKLALDVRATATLDEGDTLIAGARTWQVMFCPGHSGDLICLYDTKTQLLIGSDQFQCSIGASTQG